MKKWLDQPQNGPNSVLIPCFSLLLMAASRDRIAPNCTIRHTVWPIAALQRRMRFSAPLARFCRIRCHQRRAVRAEQASFSVLVSNLDFRVPRLRQRGERAADRAVHVGQEATRGIQNRGRGDRGVAGLASSGPGAPGLPGGRHPRGHRYPRARFARRCNQRP